MSFGVRHQYNVHYTLAHVVGICDKRMKYCYFIFIAITVSWRNFWINFWSAMSKRLGRSALAKSKNCRETSCETNFQQSLITYKGSSLFIITERIFPVKQDEMLVIFPEHDVDAVQLCVDWHQPH